VPAVDGLTTAGKSAKGEQSAAGAGARVRPLAATPRVPAILVAVIKKFSDDQGGYQVALLTHFAFLATFPLLLVFTTITETVLHNNPHLRQQLVDSALSEFPVVGTDLQSSLHTPSGSGFASP
jgi:membrane protein